MKLLLLFIALSLCLCSCATDRAGVSQPDTQQVASPQKHVSHYSGIANMKVYPSPDYKKAPIFKMPINEKVAILKTSDEWVYIKVARTGKTGWTEKTYLASKPVAVGESGTSPGTAVSAPKRQATPQHPPAKARDGKSDPLDLLKPRSAEAATPSGTEKVPPKKVDAGVFNPF